MALLRLAVFVFCFKLAHFTDPPCVIELECEECLPDNMPLVTSHRAANGSLSVPAGEELTLACGAGKFLAFPLHDALRARCQAGRYRVRADDSLRHLLELGCQESIFEDVLHQVEDCGGLQGRAYLMHAGSGAPRHLALACFDPDRAVAARLRMSAAPHNELRVRAHDEPSAPLSLLGNFNHMFDASTRHAAERLYSDDVRLNRRLHEQLKHEHFSFADQTLTSAKLLSPHYFEDQNMRVTDFVSNRVAVWRSVARGNLLHLQRDVAKLLRLSRPHDELDVLAGTHGTLALSTGHELTELFLKAGKRFPVPKYIWTVVHAKRANKAVALVLLNDPFASARELADAAPCASACGGVSWLHELRRARRLERALYGAVFCCSVHELAAAAPELRAPLVPVPPGSAGMLNELFV